MVVLCAGTVSVSQPVLPTPKVKKHCIRQLIVNRSSNYAAGTS